MSTPTQTPGPPPVPPPKAPATSLGAGTIVAGRFEILELLGTSELATSYLAADTSELERPTVALKLLDPNVRELFDAFRERLSLAQKADHRTLSRLLDFGLDDDRPYLALEYVKGQTLAQAIQKKQTAGAKFLPRTALSLITPVCHALAAAHEKTPHGALTPGNVYVERNGRVRLANLGFGWLTEQALRPSGVGATVDSPFIAPEVRRDPAAVTIRSDIFGLGMITIALLAGHLPKTGDAETLADDLLRHLPESLRVLLAGCIADDPNARPASVTAFFQQLQEAIEDLRDQLIEQTQPHEPVLETDEPEPGTRRPGRLTTRLETLLVTDELPPVPEDEGDPAVWLVHRDGFDYGPFSSEQVRDQLLQDAVDEHTEIRNLETQERGLLEDVEEFAEFVADYLPVRDERRRREAERRAEVQRKVKRAGATGMIAALVGVLGLVGLYIYYVEFIRAQPEPIPVDSLFAHVGRDFRAPESAYVGIAADPEMMAALFNFEEEIEEPPPRRSRTRSDGSHAENPESSDGTDPLDGDTIDFTRSAGNRRLTPNDINETILRDGRAIQNCLRSEISHNRSFRGTEMRFVIRPDGRTQAVDLGPGNYTEELRSCLSPIFRHMRFPEHDGLNLPVSFPFTVR